MFLSTPSRRRRHHVWRPPQRTRSKGSRKEGRKGSAIVIRDLARAVVGKTLAGRTAGRPASEEGSDLRTSREQTMPSLAIRINPPFFPKASPSLFSLLVRSCFPIIPCMQFVRKLHALYPQFVAVVSVRVRLCNLCRLGSYAYIACIFFCVRLRIAQIGREVGLTQLLYKYALLSPW